MQLQQHAIEPAVLRVGHQDGIEVAAGQTFKIEVSPDGSEILAAACPAGKRWVGRVIVEFTEMDAE